jgi:hypothetical protein
MNAQEFYDLLVKTSLEGGFPARTTNKNHCLYRGPEGRRCVTGLVLPDKLYRPEFEQKPVDSLFDAVGDHWLPTGITRMAMSRLQRVHDSQLLGDEWDHHLFLKNINQQECFKDIRRLPADAQEYYDLLLFASATGQFPALHNQLKSVSSWGASLPAVCLPCPSGAAVV